jgi:hypothetical protein
MPSRYVLILATGLNAACGSSTAASIEAELAEQGSLVTSEESVVPVSLRLCADPSEESLSGAIAAGFDPHLDADGALVSIGPVVSGSADATSLDAIEAAECVEALERADERILQTPGAP